MLTAHEIVRQMKKGNIVIEPFDKTQLNPNSYNVCLGNRLKIYDPNVTLDLKTSNRCYEEVVIPEEGIVLEPGILYIGSTKEIIGSEKFISCIDGRSSIGRLGMTVHLTAGFGDIGFSGAYTLEITVVQKLRVYPGYQIGQVYFEKPEGKVDFLYHGRYQNQDGPTESRIDQSTRYYKDYHYKGKCD